MMSTISSSSIASAAASASNPLDPTFRNYASSQAALYCKHRPAYPLALINTIISLHTSHPSAQTNILVDVGCGPGIATRSLAPHFHRAFGLDHSTSMIETASSILDGNSTQTGEKITYAISSAEEIDRALLSLGVRDKEVDMITAATAAHWFDLPKFYAAAEKMLRPGGSIALWCSGSWYCNKRTTPRWREVQELSNRFELEVLRPYELKGNRLSRELYGTIDLPWTAGVEAFSEEGYLRKTWNEGGVLEKVVDEDGVEREGFLREVKEDWEKLRAALGTTSMVTRWREANKDKLERGKVRDCVEEFIGEVEATVNEGRRKRDPEYIEEIERGSSLGLVMFRKK